jgi:hypothetical protein
MRPAAAPNAPRIEYHTAAGGPVLGLGTPRPRLSWSVPSAQAGYTQTAYEIEVSRESGIQRYRVQNAEQVLVPWPTRRLQMAAPVADPAMQRERRSQRLALLAAGLMKPASLPSMPNRCTRSARASITPARTALADVQSPTRSTTREHG